MLFQYLAHRLLWVLVFFVLCVLSLLAVDIGLIDTVLGTGEQARDGLHNGANFLRHHYGVNRENIELALKATGLAISAVLGTLGFARILYYADRHLPDRINDFLTRVDETNLSARAQLIAPYAARLLREVPLPKESDGGMWDKFLDLVHLHPTKRLLRQIKSELGSLNETLGVLGRKKQSCETQKATVHLINGLELAVQAAQIVSDSEAQRQMNHAALQEFEQILKLNENDLDGLEQAARQSQLLNSDGPAIQHLRKMARAAAAAAKPVLQARAARFQAEVLDERGTPVDLNTARRLLEAAITALLRAVDASPERDIELANLYESLGAVQGKREKYGKSDKALAEAERRYKAIPAPVGPAGLARIQALRSQSANDTKDDDDADDADGVDNSTVPTIPTHISAETLHVFDGPQVQDIPTQELLPFTTLTLIETAEGWALVGKDGLKLGYVKAEMLHELH
jgi:hypothetical protein